MDRLFDWLDELPRRADGAGSAGGRSTARAAAADPFLRRDSAKLELKPTASFEQVRRSHRRTLSRYHPDRFAGDPEKQRLATRIVQILNSSFRRIRDFRKQTD